MVEKEVVKALKLNMLPLSRRKGRLLSELFSSVLGCCNDILFIAKSANPENFAILHTTSYPVIKQKYSLHSQILVDCIHQVWENLNCKEFKQVPIRFNILVLVDLPKQNEEIPSLLHRLMETVELPCQSSRMVLIRDLLSILKMVGFARNSDCTRRMDITLSSLTLGRSSKLSGIIERLWELMLTAVASL